MIVRYILPCDNDSLHPIGNKGTLLSPIKSIVRFTKLKEQGKLSVISFRCFAPARGLQFLTLLIAAIIYGQQFGMYVQVIQ